MQALFLRKSLASISEIPGRSGSSQLVDADYTRVDSQSVFSGIFILHENIHATRVRVVELSAEELGTMSKSNS